MILRKKTDDSTYQKISRATEAVLKGSDPVLSLMDKRVRDLFRFACLLNLKENLSIPNKIQSGTFKISSLRPLNAVKEKFRTEVSSHIVKLGFYGVVDDLIEVTYDAHKIINHCLSVHEKDVLSPLAEKIRIEVHKDN